MELEKIDEISIHFIIGPGRSGTTLLAMILNQHVNCISTPEIKHFLYFYKKYRHITKISEALKKDLFSYFHIVGAGRKNELFDIEKNPFLNDLKVGSKINYAQLTKLIYLGFFDEIKDARTVTCIVDKNPFYTFHSEKILDVFPGAKFIAIVRDYRAFVLSNIQSQPPFIRAKSVFYYAYAWNFYAGKLVEIRHKYPEKLLIIHYEALAKNQEPEIRNLFSFIGLHYYPEVLDFHKTLAEKANAMIQNGNQSERIIKKITDLSKPINMERVFAWQKNLSPEQLSRIEFVCATYGREFQYEPVKSVSLLKKMYYAVISLPGFIRVNAFYMFNSIRLYHYLNDARKFKYAQSVK